MKHESLFYLLKVVLQLKKAQASKETLSSKKIDKKKF
jgi:hypothetical protein